MLLEDLKPQVKRDRDATVRYHKDIGFPEDVRLPPGTSQIIRLQYPHNAHAMQRADERKIERLPRAIDLANINLFEIWVIGRTVQKIVFRMEYDEKTDIVMSVMVPSGRVATMWLQDKNDHHRTLNRGLYADPKKQRPRP